MPDYIEHCHPQLEMHFVIHGHVAVYTEYGRYSLNDGDLLYIRGNQIHAFTAEPGTRSAMFACREEMVPLFASQIRLYGGCNCLVHTQDNMVIQTVLHLLKSNPKLCDQPQSILSVINLLLMLVIEQLPGTEQGERLIHFPDELKSALSYIALKLPDMVKLNDVA
ncbi:MAG: AraC family ligand binding domain-containing protein [Clostridia bacterium]|nr:AraC family ligand binding domain-containing protein [Clostridia bacterium]